jgi:hypothetical protein
VMSVTGEEEAGKLIRRLCPFGKPEKIQSPGNPSLRPGVQRIERRNRLVEQ